MHSQDDLFALHSVLGRHDEALKYIPEKELTVQRALVTMVFECKVAPSVVAKTAEAFAWVDTTVALDAACFIGNAGYAAALVRTAKSLDYPSKTCEHMHHSLCKAILNDELQRRAGGLADELV